MGNDVPIYSPLSFIFWSLTLTGGNCTLLFFCIALHSLRELKTKRNTKPGVDCVAVRVNASIDRYFTYFVTRQLFDAKVCEWNKKHVGEARNWRHNELYIKYVRWWNAEWQTKCVYFHSFAVREWLNRCFFTFLQEVTMFWCRWTSNGKSSKTLKHLKGCVRFLTRSMNIVHAEGMVLVHGQQNRRTMRHTRRELASAGTRLENHASINGQPSAPMPTSRGSSRMMVVEFHTDDETIVCPPASGPPATSYAWQTVKNGIAAPSRRRTATRDECRQRRHSTPRTAESESEPQQQQQPSSSSPSRRWKKIQSKRGAAPSKRHLKRPASRQRSRTRSNSAM